jgi:hypothetical protein
MVARSPGSGAEPPDSNESPGALGGCGAGCGGSGGMVARSVGNGSGVGIPPALIAVVC